MSLSTLRRPLLNILSILLDLVARAWLDAAAAVRSTCWGRSLLGRIVGAMILTYVVAARNDVLAHSNSTVEVLVETVERQQQTANGRTPATGRPLAQKTHLYLHIRAVWGVTVIGHCSNPCF